MNKHSGKQPALSIRLTEPLLFLKTSATGQDFRGRRQVVTEGPDSQLRGILTLRIDKPTRIRKLQCKLVGRTNTSWPEGIGPRRTETFEENIIIEETLCLFNAETDRQNSLDRRAMSIGPGTRIDNWDLEEGSDEEESLEGHDSLQELDRGRGRHLQRAGQRSISLMPERVIPLRMESLDVTVAANLEGQSTEDLPGPMNGRIEGRTGAVRSDHLRERGPSPAYALRDPLEARAETPRGRRASFRGSVPARRPAVLEELDISDSYLSPIASAEGSRLSSPTAGANPLAMNRVVSDTLNVRLNGTTSRRGTSEATSSARQSLSDLERLSPSTSTHSLRNMDENRIARISNGGTASPHPLHANIFSAEPSRNNSHTSLHHSPRVSTESSRLVETIRRGSQNSSVVELTPADEVPVEESQHDRHDSGSTSTFAYFQNLAGRAPGSRSGSVTRDHPRQPSLVTERSAVSPRDQAPSTDSASDQDRGRHDPNKKFSFANAFRSISRARSKPSSTPPPAPSSHYTDPLMRSSSAQAGPLMDGRMHIIAAEDREMRPFGRGGAGRSPSRPRDTSPAPKRERSESRTRGRALGLKVLGIGSEDGESPENGSSSWKEFRRGIYNYPISFMIPRNAPPSIHADFGQVSYKVTATAHRLGALMPNYVDEVEVTMIASPQEDDMEESENILVERQWEDQMRYLIALSGKAFTIGGQIPCSIRIMPMSKCKIFRLSAVIEEKIDYFALGKRVARHEAPKKYPLIAYKNADEKGGAPPLLPIISESTDALWLSPLSAMAVQARERDETEDDAIASLLNPVGPWHLETMLQVPDCQSKIKFSTKHESTNMTIAHWLKITIRVQRGDDVALDSKGRRKQFDIIIETPLHLLDCRATSQNNSLPSYNLASNMNHTIPAPSVCRIHKSKNAANNVPLDLPNTSNHLSTIVTRAGASVSPAGRVDRSNSTSRARHDSVGHMSNASDTLTVVEAPDTLLERNIVFDRLVSGQESEAGEAPPAYDEVGNGGHRSRSRNPRGRSPSRLREEIA